MGFPKLIIWAFQNWLFGRSKTVYRSSVSWPEPNLCLDKEHAYAKMNMQKTKFKDFYMNDISINTQQHIIMYVLKYSIDYMVHGSLQLCSFAFLSHVCAQCEDIYVMGWTPHCQCHFLYSHLAQAFQEVDTPSPVCLSTPSPGWRCTDTTGTSCPVLLVGSWWACHLWTEQWCHLSSSPETMFLCHSTAAA